MIVIPVWDFFENFSVLRQQRIVLWTPFSRALLYSIGAAGQGLFSKVLQ